MEYFIIYIFFKTVLGVICVRKKKNTEQIIKVHMVKHYTTRNSVYVINEKMTFFWGIGQKKIMIPTVILNLYHIKPVMFQVCLVIERSKFRTSKGEPYEIS